MRNRWWAGPGLAAAVVLLAACGSTAASGSGSGSPSSSAAAAGGGTTAASKKVLTNSAGFTLYWFSIDTPKKSNCNGTCATFWLPVPASAKITNMTSLPGTFGKIKRADGSKQLTYGGRPLYTFKEDTAPGQDNGNGKNLSGGLWWAETPSGLKLTAAKAKPTSSSGGGNGGYGY
jgi:predicted lipoprotein with Yx(FWY)xxD motif